MGGIGQLQDQTEKKITSENLDPNKREDGSGFVSDNVDKTCFKLEPTIHCMYYRFHF